MSKIYKVYCDFGGWDIIGVCDSPYAAFRTIYNRYDGKSIYIVVEHDTELDIDSAYKTITSEDKLIKFKSEVENDVSRGTEGIYKVKKL